MISNGSLMKRDFAWENDVENATVYAQIIKNVSYCPWLGSFVRSTTFNLKEAKATASWLTIIILLHLLYSYKGTVICPSISTQRNRPKIIVYIFARISRKYNLRNMYKNMTDFQIAFLPPVPMMVSLIQICNYIV